MPNQLLLTLNPNRISVGPGTSGELAITVQNLSTLLDQVTLRAEGIDPSWVQIIPSTLPVFAEGQATARLIVSPPLDPSQSQAGVYQVQIHGSMQENREQESHVSAELQVQLVGDYQVQIDAAQPPGGQDAAFDVKVRNGANAQMQLSFTSGDPQNAAWYVFNPFRLKIPAGGETSTVLTARPKTASKEDRSIAFTLTSEGEYVPRDGVPVEAPPHQVSSQFSQQAAPKAPAHVSISIAPDHAESLTEAQYQVLLENSGELPGAVHLAGACEDKSLEFHLDTPEATIAPGAQALVHLVVRPLAPIRQGENLVKTFRVTASAEGGAEPVVAQASFTRLKKPFPWKIVLAAVLILCIGITLFMLVLAALLQRGGLLPFRLF